MVEQLKEKENKIVRFALYVVYGVAFGIATIIPGLSGATIAVIFGFYERLISAVSNFFTEFKKHILFLIFFFIGVAIGAYLIAFLLNWLLSISQIGVCFAFIGLVVGSMPSVIKESGIQVKKLSVWEIIAFLLAGGVMCFLALFNSSAEIVLGTDSFLHVFNLFWVGFVTALGPVAPGISGSMLLAIITGMGGYNQLLSAVKGLDVLTLLPFGAGVVLGCFALSIMIKFCLAKARKVTYAVLLGFVIFSVVPLYVKAEVDTFNLEVIISIIVAVAFAVAVFFLLRLFAKKQNTTIKTNENEPETPDNR